MEPAIKDLNKLFGNCCIAMSVKLLPGFLKAAFSLEFLFGFHAKHVHLSTNES